MMLMIFYSFRLIPSKALDSARVNKPYDVIIVPGVPFEDGKWSDIMKARVYWSHYLYEQGIANNVIYSGSSVYSPYVEAEIMSLYGQQLGIPGENIYTETRAEHSTENLYYSYQLAQELGFQTIALATDPFQSFLLEFFKKKVNSNIRSIPICFKILKQLPRPDVKIDAELAYVEDFVSLYERENFFQRFTGTLGRRIER